MLALLAWDDLGLGAWLVPLVPSPIQQVLAAGPHTVVFRADAGQLTTGGPNTVAVAVQAEMAGMAMAAPRVPMSVEDPRQRMWYVAHPRFSTAGIWQLILTISAAGSLVRRATATVSVRWGRYVSRHSVVVCLPARR